MPRTTELVAEESAPVSSPLRRSSRIVAVSAPPAEAMKTIKGRRSSVTKENNDEEKVDAKPTRGKRASSITKEETPKSEPAKPKTRRSSITTEQTKEEEVKRQPIGRGRRSSANEEVLPEQAKQTKGKTSEEETVKRPLRGRRSSINEEKSPEEQTNVRTTRSTRSVSREVSLEPEEKKPVARGRRKSVEVQDAEPVERKTVKTRRSSVEKLEGEPDMKIVKIVLTRPKRRLSITENAVNLAPIEEKEGERKSLSPVANKTPEGIQLTPIKKKPEPVKTELDLSVIDESSFNEDADVTDDTTKTKFPKTVTDSKITTPKKSPRFRQSKSPKEQEISAEPTDENNLEQEDITPAVKENILSTPKKSPRKSGGQTDLSEQNLQETMEEDTSKVIDSSSTPRKSPRLSRATTDEKEALAVEIPIEDSDTPACRKSPRIQAKSMNVSPETNPNSLVEPKENQPSSTPQKESKDDDSVFTSQSPVPEESTHLSPGSDDSLKLNLSSTRLLSSQDEDDLLNSSKSSSSSDKENVAVNHEDNPTPTKVTKTPMKIVNALIEGKEAQFEQNTVVARISNVFRPKNVDYSFAEPMEVDKPATDLETTVFDKSANESKIIAAVPDEPVDESCLKTESALAKQPEPENPKEPEVENQPTENLEASPKPPAAPSSNLPDVVIDIEKPDDAPAVAFAEVVQEASSKVSDDSVLIVEEAESVIAAVEPEESEQDSMALNSTGNDQPRESKAADMPIILDESASDDLNNVTVSKKNMSQDYDFDLPSEDDNDMEATKLLDSSKPTTNGHANDSIIINLDDSTSDSDGMSNNAIQKDTITNGSTIENALQNAEGIVIEAKTVLNLDESIGTCEKSDLSSLEKSTETTNDETENTETVEVSKNHEIIQDSSVEKGDECCEKSEDQHSSPIKSDEMPVAAQETNPILASSGSAEVSEEVSGSDTITLPVSIPLDISEGENKSKLLQICLEADHNRTIDENYEKAVTEFEEMEKSFQDIINNDISALIDKVKAGNKSGSEDEKQSSPLVEKSENKVDDVTEKANPNDSMEDMTVSNKLKRITPTKLSATKSRKSKENEESGSADPDEKSISCERGSEDSVHGSSPKPKDKKSGGTNKDAKKPKTKLDDSESKVTPNKLKSKDSNKSLLDAFIDKKIAEFGEESSDDSNEESNDEEGSSYGTSLFLDDMAEEGEEDTPSEGSNDIIDEGESIHTESDRESEDDYDSNDSFICNNDENQLLPGDEYDLEDGDYQEKKKKRKSRIINVDDVESDIITIERKDKPVKPKKKSRIIKSTDSSDEETEEPKIIETESPVAPSTCQLSSNQGPLKRKSSLTIVENINVQEIKDAPLSERIHNLVDNFCTTIPKKGDISMNLSLEFAGKSSSESSLHEDNKSVIDSKKQKSPFKIENTEIGERKSSSSAEETPAKKKRLSASLDSLPKRKTQKRKLSLSLDETETKPPSKTKKSKKERKQQPPVAQKMLPLSEKALKAESFSLMNRLITDIKTRPRRNIASTYNTETDYSWVIDTVGDMKPSTSIVSKKEIENFKKDKRHPKDFRNAMLYDSSRVKRVETKTLLKKRGAYF